MTKDLPRLRLAADVVSYNALLSRVGSKEALQLLQGIEAVKLRPDVYSFNSAISACQKGCLTGWVGRKGLCHPPTVAQ
jgi:hypothetical protein